jgi:acetyltransferase-like isoleucine patch superfamily enzyme
LQKRGAWIGSSTIILPGVIIAEDAVVGAGTIVTKPIPLYAVFAGNPGKIIK